ncbi:hypothetical protein KSP39_PZI017012 [Platanthera zijinensis]|uniref:VQ domain-containing protein n=1 Tax=Platanthera zijinensis TaxID=2320716 RepID=A0AAP0B7W1_9ASPA
MEKNCCSAAPTNSAPSSAATTTSAPSSAASFSADDSKGGSVCSAGSGRSTSIINTSNHMANSLRSFHKSSYKISKPVSRNPSPNPIRPSPPPSSSTSAIGSGVGPLQQPQPPVYNIDKNDFRDVVQKLTGSPAHLSNRPGPPSISTTSPLQPPSRLSAVPRQLSRLHRIRPPPLAQLAPHAPPPISTAISTAGEGWVRPPLSPLPPFPTVSAAAESPISAYMRRFHSGQPFLAQSPPGMAPPPLLLPLSPLSFGCAPSPRTAISYQVMFSPNMLFPTTPAVPIPSPK